MSRILVRFSPNTELVPLNNQIVINSYVNRVLGPNNEFHGNQRTHCISRLIGGTMVGNGLDFKKGAYITFTSLDEEFINRVITGVLENQDLLWGMKFNGIDVMEEKFYNGWNHFFTLTPFMIKSNDGTKTPRYHTFKDPDFTEVVKQRLMGKLMAVYPGINLTGFEVKIDPPHNNTVTKVLLGTAQKRVANHCQISIQCSADVARKIYSLGIGQSTGSMGLGTIYKTENHNKYML